MNDLYQEILIKKKSGPLDGLKKAGMIGLTVLALFAGLFIHILFIPVAIGLGILSWFVINNLDLEYEYLYVNGDLDIDKIMNKQKRKRMASYAIGSLEYLAYATSHELDSYQNGRNTKVYDFTSGEEGRKVVAAVYSREGGYDLVRLELNETILKDIRRIAPRKISRDLAFL